ncbi:L-threonylcarbamoyladenylate synthase [Hyunsoonleella pacifica]|uniref:L-threonylcarbamoyladenylate synthase n=1 Tax=Hyunsoonleella pacifica TaxID=1080224 RepID=A0A4Q9FPX4_9FLAO|nr:Sua5/YciO/YrdC/YwlC family protein [Hyunsoonleella pacifica]TBN17535.1 translation factor Sua5 [Hyunsoonleella pacifica]GGD11112.1 translation factor Sua5 [Hyunsoonleella pacifica]
MPNLHAEVKTSSEILKSGGVILFPTDTFWSIGCDATNKKAVEHLFDFMKNNSKQNVTCLMADDRMLSRYIESLPFAAQSIIEITDTPTTIIYDNPKNLAVNLVSKHNTLATRIPDDEFCYQLSRRINAPIASLIAHFNNKPIPKSFKEIEPSVLKGVDYVVNLHREKKCVKPASIIQIKNNGIVKVIHK